MKFQAFLTEGRSKSITEDTAKDFIRKNWQYIIDSDIKIGDPWIW